MITAACVFSANQSGETALDIARRLKNAQCEEPVRDMPGCHWLAGDTFSYRDVMLSLEPAQFNELSDVL